MDGIKNHLWKALKTAVQTWFNEKLESLLGLGKSVLNLLTKGGISMAQVGKMAFEALKAAIPPALIALLVERLVSMIVPAAGAVMAVVQGLMAAWGAIQKILAAIDRFIAFLKAVKSGGAGPAFANALAAAAVAVIEFVSQFLLRKIAGAASKVAGKIKAIAQKIGKQLMKVVKKVGKGLKKVGKKLKRGATQGSRTRSSARRKKTTEGPKDKKKDDKQDKQDRLDKAVARSAPKVTRAASQKGTSELLLKAQLADVEAALPAQLARDQGSGKTVGVRAKVNPEADIIRNVIQTTGDLLHEQVERVWPIVVKDSRVQAAVQKMRQQRTDNWEDRSDEQSKKGRQTVGPYNRSTVDDPGVGGAAGADVGTGLLGADGKPLGNHTIETTRFLDSSGDPLASTSERREAGGPGMIFVTGGGRYHERSDIANMSLAESQTFGTATAGLAIPSADPRGRRRQHAQGVRAARPGRAGPRPRRVRHRPDARPVDGLRESDRGRGAARASDGRHRRHGHLAPRPRAEAAPGERVRRALAWRGPQEARPQEAVAEAPQVHAGRPGDRGAVGDRDGPLLGS